ncbi:hypothetical protein Cenrod_0501 [Candidatus Symbiobacter mobilis CR]|uniref:Uncharacterized protein n=1 Tax=Candidatus Symbiobacter mobilis CR TaxID=946483 RepID=U5N5R3_9BURK|nr:hypothetical protein Cenrod_0501 [Candidatus Symbiobacter mobilis CR]
MHDFGIAPPAGRTCIWWEVTVPPDSASGAQSPREQRGTAHA